jgi:hypothetical protein
MVKNPLIGKQTNPRLAHAQAGARFVALEFILHERCAAMVNHAYARFSAHRLRRERRIRRSSAI